MEDLKILVVDADPKNLQILKETFEASGFLIDTAVDGDKAWEILNSSQPDLILSEVNLPDYDGFQFLQKIKQNSATAHIPVVFLTNRRDLQDRVRSLRGGVKDYLIKPVHVKEVIARIRMILRRLERVKNEEMDSSNKVVGRLEESSVIELIENFGMERRSGVLSIYNENNKNGEIHFRGGGIVYASLGMIKAEKAIYQMLPWKCGHYIITFREVNTADSISVSNLGLLLQGFRRLEERENLIKKLPSLETTFVLSKSFQQIISQKELASDVAKFLNLINGKRDIQQIIDESVYDDIKTLERLVKLSNQGFIVPGTGKENETPQIKVGGSIGKETIEELPLPEPPVESVQEHLGTEEFSTTMGNGLPPIPDDHKSPAVSFMDEDPEEALDRPEDEQFSSDELQTKPDDVSSAKTEDLASPHLSSQDFPAFDDFSEDIDSDRIISETEPSSPEPDESDESEEYVAPPMPMDMKDFAPDTDIFEIIQELKKDRELDVTEAKLTETHNLNKSTPHLNGGNKSTAVEPSELESDPEEKEQPEAQKTRDLSFSFPKRNYGFISKAGKESASSPAILFNEDPTGTSTNQNSETDSRSEQADTLDGNVTEQSDELLDATIPPNLPAAPQAENGSPLSIFPEDDNKEANSFTDFKNINQIFLDYLQFAKKQPGTFVIIGSTQTDANNLVNKICNIEQSQAQNSNQISIGTLKLDGGSPFKLLAISMEQQFTKLLNGIQSNLTGFLLLFQAGDKKQIEYLNYFYSALNKKYKLPVGIALLKSQGKKSLAPATIRDLINGDESDFIANLNQGQINDVSTFLSDLHRHYTAIKDREEHETD